MIKFFRHIRKKLVGENKFTKYLIYAIGEIILVVIGILIALQINNWNSNRVNNDKEVSILNELKTEYLEKLNELNQKDRLRALMIEHSGKLLSHIQNNNVSIKKDTFLTHIAYSTLMPTFDASNGVTEELLNSGNLYLISSKPLRQQLLSWHSAINKMTEEEELVYNTLSNQLIPYLHTRIPYNNIVTSISEVWEFIIKSSKEIKINIKNSNKPFDIKSMMNDITFESYITSINFYSIIASLQAKDLRKNINTTLSIIEEELTHKIND